MQVWSGEFEAWKSHDSRRPASTISSALPAVIACWSVRPIGDGAFKVDEFLACYYEHRKDAVIWESQMQ